MGAHEGLTPTTRPPSGGHVAGSAHGVVILGIRNSTCLMHGSFRNSGTNSCQSEPQVPKAQAAQSGGLGHVPGGSTGEPTPRPVSGRSPPRRLPGAWVSRPWRGRLQEAARPAPYGVPAAQAAMPPVSALAHPPQHKPGALERGRVPPLPPASCTQCAAASSARALRGGPGPAEAQPPALPPGAPTRPGPALPPPQKQRHWGDALARPGDTATGRGKAAGPPGRGLPGRWGRSRRAGTAHLPSGLQRRGGAPWAAAHAA